MHSCGHVLPFQITYTKEFAFICSKNLSWPLSERILPCPKICWRSTTAPECACLVFDPRGNLLHKSRVPIEPYYSTARLAEQTRRYLESRLPGLQELWPGRGQVQPGSRRVDDPA